MSERAGRIRPSPTRIEALDLRALFETHYASIWRLLRRLGVPAAQLDDAAQEVFWVAARRLSDIEPGRAHPFLYGVALRIAANELRRQRALPAITEIGQVPSMADHRPSPEEEVAARQERRLLDDVLGRLPIDLRTVLVLFELEVEARCDRSPRSRRFRSAPPALACAAPVRSSRPSPSASARG